MQLKYIEDNITDKISINDVAGTIGISGAHLMRLFKKYTGFTIITYITNLKLEHALIDIQSGAGIADVAYKYSFTDAAYFAENSKTDTKCLLTDIVKIPKIDESNHIAACLSLANIL